LQASGVRQGFSQEINFMNGVRQSNPRPQRRSRPSGRSHAGPRQHQNGATGNALRDHERYLTLAREAALAGDTIEAENCYQHAEHYFRVMNNRE
jgi:hypothetical protein